MDITNAQYRTGMGEFENTNISVTCTIDGQVWNIPLDPANRHYAEIMRQVDAGELTIADAD